MKFIPIDGKLYVSREDWNELRRERDALKAHRDQLEGERNIALSERNELRCLLSMAETAPTERRCDGCNKPGDPLRQYAHVRWARVTFAFCEDCHPKQIERIPCPECGK